jgi:2-polyprenyl-6-methoxyphenol hydroxylase-like FAD-dependent oxidoreductase
MITSSALETPKKWPGFMDRVRAIASPPDFYLRKFDGTFIQHHAPGDPKNPSLNIYRKRLHNLLNTYVKELGIPVTYETKVGTYFETNHTGGVILDTGKRITADVVVAADGVGSKSREIIGTGKSRLGQASWSPVLLSLLGRPSRSIRLLGKNLLDTTIAHPCILAQARISSSGSTRATFAIS